MKIDIKVVSIFNVNHDTEIYVNKKIDNLLVLRCKFKTGGSGSIIIRIIVQIKYAYSAGEMCLR